MKKNCNNKNPLTRGGTSQPQRILKTLQKDYVQIDEHGYADLILFAKSFASHLKYYNKDNQVDGSWEEFFSCDVSVLLSFIADNDINEFDSLFQDIIDLVKTDIQNLYNAANLTVPGNLKASVKNNLPDHFPNFKKLYDFILSLGNLIDQQIDQLPDKTGFKAFAEATIRQHCNTPFRNLLGFYKVGVEGNGAPSNYIIIDNTDRNAFPGSRDLSQKYTQDIIQDGLSSMWLSNEDKWSAIYTGLNSADFLYAYGTNAPPVMTKPIHVEQWIRPAIKEIESIYNSLSKAFLKIISESARYLEETLNEWPDHTPHIALYLSFLKLFRFAQDGLNGVKERHVDFYFKEILHHQERPAKPDEVFTIIELAKQVNDFLLEKDTSFKAGKDSEGKELIYKATAGTAINKASVAQLKSIFHNLDNSKTYFAPISNSEDGLGEALTSEDGHWKPFGPITKFVDENGIPEAPVGSEPEPIELFSTINQVAEIGFAVASPNLFLKGGARTVKLAFFVDVIDLLNPLSATSWSSTKFKILFTGEEGWIEKTPDQNPVYAGGKLTVRCQLAADDPKIIPYDKKIHKGTFQTEAPIAKVLLLDDDSNIYVYNDLRKFKITSASTEVNVTDLKDFVVQNDIGRLDLAKPILPFGALAKVGSSFIIGSKEIFQKTLITGATSGLQVNILWDGLDNITNTYTPPADVTVNCAYLKGNKWSLTSSPTKNLLLNNLASPQANISLNSSLPSLGKTINKDFDFSNDAAYTSIAKEGFIRLALNKTLGQNDFQRGYTEALIELSKDGGDLNNVSDDQFKTGLKDPPYAPSFKEVSINYSAASPINLSKVIGDTFDNRAEQFFHIHPFGQAEQHHNLNVVNEDLTLVPQFDFSGELLVGIKDFQPQQSVSVLFQLAEGTANPLKTRQDVFWYYLYKNKWTPFKDNEKANLNDQTNGLLQSGLITFFLPKKISTDNTLLDTGFVWLKAAVKNDVDAICDIIDVKTQAIRLRFEDQDNADDILATPLAPKKIKKMLQPVADIKKIDQPYTSFGGKLKEQSKHFYKRISERLRHKDRAITIWDYEHLVLEAFPEIYTVKCLNQTQLRTDPLDENRKFLNEIAPGYVLLVTIPNLQHRNAVASLTPYTSLNTLSQINNFIQKRISSHVQLNVVNPLFEQIELDFQIEFRENIDFTLFKKILNQDILKFLSPWAFENENQTQIEFGGRICKSVLLDFIEELPYVDFVTQFKLNQLISPTEQILDVEEVIASSPRSVLVSVSQHKIYEVVKECI